MIVDINFLQQNFPKYNKEYFNGELDMPRFELITNKTTLGQFQGTRRLTPFGNPINQPIIRMSIYYDRNPKDLAETLIHEMIHYYIWAKNIQDNGSHGKVWKSMAEKINRSGWSISRTTSVDNCAINPIFDRGKKTKILFYAYQVPENKSQWFTFISSENNRYIFEKTLLDNFNNTHRICRYIIGTANKVDFNKYGMCQKRIHGHYVTNNDLKELLTKVTIDVSK